MMRMQTKPRSTHKVDVLFLHDRLPWNRAHQVQDSPCFPFSSDSSVSSASLGTCSSTSVPSRIPSQYVCKTSQSNLPRLTRAGQTNPRPTSFCFPITTIELLVTIDSVDMSRHNLRIHSPASPKAAVDFSETSLAEKQELPLMPPAHNPGSFPVAKLAHIHRTLHVNTEFVKFRKHFEHLKLTQHCLIMSNHSYWHFFNIKLVQAVCAG